MGLARVRGTRGECPAYFDLMKRVVVLIPDDPIARRWLLEALLAAGHGEDEARAEIQLQTDLFGKLGPHVALRGDLERALRFGAFDDAQTDFEKFQATLAEGGSSSLAFLTARLAVFEEIGDEAGAAALLRRFVGYRAARSPMRFDAIAISGLRRHRVMTPAAITALRDTWRADTERGKPLVWDGAIPFAAALASTPAEAQ